MTSDNPQLLEQLSEERERNHALRAEHAAPLRFALKEWRRIKSGGAPWRAPHLGAAAHQGASALWKKKKTAEGLISSVKDEINQRALQPSSCEAENLGIAVFAYDRAESLVAVLEALSLQGAISMVHVFIDGDQGRPAKRAEIDFVYECARHYPVRAIHRNNGHLGFRKMMLLAMKSMMAQYEKIVFLEDDCFPVRGAINSFDHALLEIADNPEIFSVYGHPFLFSGEENGSARFQGWGWATTASKLKPVWEQLLECYLMTEEDYLSFVDKMLTAEMVQTIDITPGRLPSDTLRRFFAWDETLCLLTAMRGMRHQLSASRLIYNFGAGGKSSHFRELEYFRKPPFNMISIDEIWDHY